MALRFSKINSWFSQSSSEIGSVEDEEVASRTAAGVVAATSIVAWWSAQLQAAGCLPDFQKCFLLISRFLPINTQFI